MKGDIANISLYVKGNPVPYTVRGYLEFGIPPFDAPVGYIAPVRVFRSVALDDFLYGKLIEQSSVIFFTQGREYQVNQIVKNKGVNTYDIFVRIGQPYDPPVYHEFQFGGRPLTFDGRSMGVSE